MLCNDCSDSVEKEPLDWVIVQSSKGIGDVEPMVPRVKMSVKKLVGVE
jgi:hypothetical protein